MLPEPACYRPYSSGKYNSRPNLYKLGSDFENGNADKKILQIDRHIDRYRQAKLDARNSGYSNYINESFLHESDAYFINQVVANIACKEYPDLFSLQETGDETQLTCVLSSEVLRFDKNGRFISSELINQDPPVPYTSGLDALACQIQEDICVLKVDEDSSQLVAAHLCFPNRWSVTEKIGKNFLEIHKPVTGFSDSNPNSAKLLHAILNSGPYVRFAWGLSNDEILDHHPDHAPAFAFNKGENKLYIRTERQVLLGFPESNLVLFFIRTYYEDIRVLATIDGLASQLASALISIDEGLLRYKGLHGQREIIVNWLKSFC